MDPAKAPIQEGQLLWAPRLEFAAGSNMARFQAWLRSARGIVTADYESLWRWSVSEPAAFWTAIWDYFDILHDGSYASAMSSLEMLGVRWFEGARVNYAEHLLRHESVAGPDEVVFHHLSETRPLRTMTWHTLGSQVRILATQLRAMGVKPGDRVVSYMPNVPETAIAMMATVAIGAVWSSAAIEFGVRTVVDRFAQIAPKVIFVADGYRFAGKTFSRDAEVRRIIAELPSLEQIIWLPYLAADSVPPDGTRVTPWLELVTHPSIASDRFHFERVGHGHPVWIVFSSGTTGLPKPIVHSHVGVLLEHLKLMHFHINLGPHSVMFFYSTTGWMMWNILLAALLAGSAAVLYDGSPVHPAADLLWKLAADTGTSSFGASPTFIQMMEKAGLCPKDSFDLSRIESIVVSGAPSFPETFAGSTVPSSRISGSRPNRAVRRYAAASSALSRHCRSTPAKFKHACWVWMFTSGTSREKKSSMRSANSSSRTHFPLCPFISGTISRIGVITNRISSIFRAFGVTGISSRSIAAGVATFTAARIQR